MEYGKYDIPHASTAFTICRLLIHKPESKLLMSPVSGKRYIKHEDLFVVIEQNNITIVNHVYKYNIPAFGKAFYRITDMFDNQVEKRRQDMENEIMENVKFSLHKIVDELKQTEIK